MIVYGDPSFQVTARDFLSRISEQTLRADRASLESRRDLLILAGQFEQAIADRCGTAEPVRQLQSFTDLAADSFLGYTNGSAIRELLENTHVPPDLSLRVKDPEGFSFYSLYPEQYAQSAEAWNLEHAGDRHRPVIVVGIRSIGTTLSAVVARVLSRAGWLVSRATVRPTGHPYDRRVESLVTLADPSSFGIVVDEGPGQSGSSMAAVASALGEAGLDRRRISFFPGHSHGPGTMGSPETRRWWAETRSYCTTPEYLVWKGRSLREELAQGCGEPLPVVEEFGSGAWRRAVYLDESGWPPVFSPFERAKYRTMNTANSGFVWKFEGLGGGAERSLERQNELARKGWTAAPVKIVHGFVATPWISGQRLARASTGMLRQMGRYIAGCSGSEMSHSEQEAARNRLGEMLYWNTLESLGEGAAERSREWRGQAPEASCRAYGDGRLGPEEWIRAENGRLLKVDCSGHERDHTIVGRQPVLWDLAGAMVEWRLEGAAAQPLLSSFVESGGGPVNPSALKFYCMCYAAFRMGQCVLCARTSSPREETRLVRAASSYRARLSRLLGA